MQQRSLHFSILLAVAAAVFIVIITMAETWQSENLQGSVIYSSSEGMMSTSSSEHSYTYSSMDTIMASNCNVIGNSCLSGRNNQCLDSQRKATGCSCVNSVCK